MTQRKQLPIGIQTFREIRQDNHYYIDKTNLALSLINHNKHCFLSRPRRFGKSLFIDTLKELFEGNELLFRDLAIHGHWDWSVKYPVMRFSFGSKNYNNAKGLEDSLHTQLSYLEDSFSVQRRFDDASGRLSDLIIKTHQQHGQPVVILIDEYDKPILDAINQPDIARENRDFLRGFYGTIKDYDAHIKFSFLTGVSKFAKVSLFSGLNNLSDITLDPRYSTICGYTDHDIDTVFADEIKGLDRHQIKEWYNGYNWLGEGVYNPFDILKLFDNRTFKNYWFETGTPTFLIDLIHDQQISSPNLAKRNSDESLLSSFDLEYMPIEAVMFQTGYLTITDTIDLGGSLFYQLGYPNKEVYQSLNNSLLQYFVQNGDTQATQRMSLYTLLLANDFDSLKKLFHGFFASIPHQWYNKNEIQNYEGYYASVFYSYFAALGLDITVEDATNHGRIDMTLKFQQRVYIFEFKVVELVPDGSALQQIKDKAYAEKYRELGQQMYLIGVEFSKEDRNIVAFEVEEA